MTDNQKTWIATLAWLISFIAVIMVVVGCNQPTGPTIRHAWDVCLASRAEGDWSNPSCHPAFTTREIGPLLVCAYDPEGNLQPDRRGDIRGACPATGDPTGCFSFDQPGCS
jgi:hypothetical protein